MIALVVAMLLVILVLAFVACGSDDATKPSAAPTNQYSKYVDCLERQCKIDIEVTDDDRPPVLELMKYAREKCQFQIRAVLTLEFNGYSDDILVVC